MGNFTENHQQVASEQANSRFIPLSVVVKTPKQG